MSQFNLSESSDKSKPPKFIQKGKKKTTWAKTHLGQTVPRCCSNTKCTADRQSESTEAYFRRMGPINEKRLSLLTCSSCRCLENPSVCDQVCKNKTLKKRKELKELRKRCLYPRCCELAIVRSNKFVKVVLHFLQHRISQRIQLAPEGVVNGMDFAGGCRRAKLLVLLDANGATPHMMCNMRQ